MQDLIGDQFGTYGTVASFSWLSSDMRRQGVGTEMRQAILHFAFEGVGATEATTEAFLDNPARTVFPGQSGTRRTASAGRPAEENQA